MSLRSISDAALAAHAARGDSAAFAELARRYRGLIAQISREPAFGLTFDDQRQEALIGLFGACRAHRRHPQARFGAMATVCVRRRVWYARETARTRKHRVLGEALHFDHCDGDDPDAQTLAERIPAPGSTDPAVVVELREELRALAASARFRASVRSLAPGRRRYTDAEKRTALALLAEGKSLRQAAAAIGANHYTVLQWRNRAA